MVESGRVVMIEIDKWLSSWLRAGFSRITYVMLRVPKHHKFSPTFQRLPDKYLFITPEYRINIQ